MEAAGWYRKAAEQGFAVAQYLLAGRTRTAEAYRRVIAKPRAGISRQPNRGMLLPNIPLEIGSRKALA